MSLAPRHFDTPGDSEYITYYAKDKEDFKDKDPYNQYEIDMYSVHTNVIPVNKPFKVSYCCDLIRFTILIPSCHEKNNSDLVQSFTVPIVELNVDKGTYKILQTTGQMKSYVKRIYNEYYTIIPVYHGFKNPIVLEKSPDDREYTFKMDSSVDGILIQTHEYTLYRTDLRYVNNITLYTEIYSRVLNRIVKSNEQVSVDIQEPFTKCLYFIVKSRIKSVRFLPLSSTNKEGGRLIDGKLLHVKGDIYRLPFCDRPELFKYTGSINLGSSAKYNDTKLTFEFEQEESSFIEIYDCRSNYIFGPEYENVRYYGN